MIVPNVCYLLHLLLKTNCFITEVNFGLLNCLRWFTLKFKLKQIGDLSPCIYRNNLVSIYFEIQMIPNYYSIYCFIFLHILFMVTDRKSVAS